MLGSEFVDALKAELKLKTDSQLARATGVTPGRIAQVRVSKVVTPKAAGKLAGRIASLQAARAFKSAISPIVEFFPAD